MRKRTVPKIGDMKYEPKCPTCGRAYRTGKNLMVAIDEAMSVDEDACVKIMPGVTAKIRRNIKPETLEALKELVRTVRKNSPSPVKGEQGEAK